MQLKKDMIIKHLSMLQPKLIIIFGSYAKDRQHTKSDLDIAFLSDSTINSYKRWLLAQNIAIELDIDVDLVDLSCVNDVLRFEIVSNGIVILNDGMDNFLDRSYTNYFQLNDDRGEILANYDR
jgi:predicted nucleotidyltransferase